MEMPSGEDPQRESPKGRKAQESISPRPELILRMAERGTAFRGGMKPLKRRREAERFCGKAQERKGRRKRRSDHPEGERL